MATAAQRRQRGFQGQEVGDVIKAGADWVHVDIMDGRFAPYYVIGPLVVQDRVPDQGIGTARRAWR